MRYLPPPEDNEQCVVSANRRVPLHNSGGTLASIYEDWWCSMTWHSLLWSSLSSLCLDVTNIAVWVTVTALWVMKTKIAGDQMKALGVVWSELLHLVIRDKNRNMLTLRILIDQISYKHWLWITSKNEITCTDFFKCHHNRLHSLVRLFLTTWISSSYLARGASYFSE